MSKRHFLEFEQPIAELESKIEELRYVQSESAVDISEEIDRLSKKSQLLTKDIYANLTPWQVTQIARHPQRPYTLDYVNELFTDFQEMHGDRHFADDLSIVGGLARFNGQACMVVGHQKGRDTKERAARNFGMSRPEGYRKALRLMQTAEKAPDAAEALGITAHRLKALGLVDKIISEPVGGAHRDHKQAAANLKRGLNDALRQVSDLKVKDLLQSRYERLQSYGRFTDTKER